MTTLSSSSFSAESFLFSKCSSSSTWQWFLITIITITTIIFTNNMFTPNRILVIQSISAIFIRQPMPYYIKAIPFLMSICMYSLNISTDVHIRLNFASKNKKIVRVLLENRGCWFQIWSPIHHSAYFLFRRRMIASQDVMKPVPWKIPHGMIFALLAIQEARSTIIFMGRNAMKFMQSTFQLFKLVLRSEIHYLRLAC